MHRPCASPTESGHPSVPFLRHPGCTCCPPPCPRTRLLRTCSLSECPERRLLACAQVHGHAEARLLFVCSRAVLDRRQGGAAIGTCRRSGTRSPAIVSPLPVRWQLSCLLRLCSIRMPRLLSAPAHPGSWRGRFGPEGRGWLTPQPARTSAPVCRSCEHVS